MDPNDSAEEEEIQNRTQRTYSLSTPASKQSAQDRFIRTCSLSTPTRPPQINNAHRANSLSMGALRHSKKPLLKRHDSVGRASIRRYSVISDTRRASLEPSTASLTSRGNWGSKWEFLLSCIGLSVGIGNVWRFPYLAYKNGGGAFLIPYLIMLFLAGKPMYFLELALGQFAGVGPITIWSCCPIFKGLGIAMVAVSLIVCIYYNVIMAYTLYFIGSTFQAELPWARCDPSWVNLSLCYVRTERNLTTALEARSSSQVFWENKVLELTSGIEDLGGLKLDLVACLFVSWIIVCFCLIKGIKTSGKVVYFAATFPYVVLFILLVAGLTQKGAMQGVLYFITPDWKKLLDIQVWQSAAGQMFYSLSVSMGALIMYSSYNDFRNNIFRDALVVSILDTFTSIISGVVIFSILGAMAYELGEGTNIEDVVAQGPGLAFVAYPEALSRLPLPQLWSILFFLMLFILGLDSEFALLENILTSICDEFPYLRNYKTWLCIGTCFSCFLLGLPCVTRGGQYILAIMDKYGGGIAVLFIAIFESVAILWFYGLDRFCDDLYFMTQKRASIYWRITWKYTSPIILTFILIYSIIKHESLTYGELYKFPAWADGLGWCLTLFSILQIPIWAFIIVYSQKKKGCKKKFINALKPSEEWGPSDEELHNEWKIGHKDIPLEIQKPIAEKWPSQSSVDNPAFSILL